MPHRWDAVTYDRLPLPHLQWGARAIERLRLRGDERVLDAGAGTGRVTEQLLEHLPSGQVVALDASETMLHQLRRRTATYGDRVEIVQGDLREPLVIDPPVDAVLSTATLHWIADHDAVFRNLAAVMCPGGRLVVDCGGRGNIVRVGRVLRAMGREDRQVWNFAGPEATRERLERAGFTEIETWLQPDPAVLAPGEQFRSYLATVVLGAHIEDMSADDQEAFVNEVAERMGEPIVDYVRLNIVAMRR